MTTTTPNSPPTNVDEKIKLLFIQYNTSLSLSWVLRPKERMYFLAIPSRCTVLVRLSFLRARHRIFCLHLAGYLMVELNFENHFVVCTRTVGKHSTNSPKMNGSENIEYTAFDTQSQSQSLLFYLSAFRMHRFVLNIRNSNFVFFSSLFPGRNRRFNRWDSFQWRRSPSKLHFGRCRDDGQQWHGQSGRMVGSNGIHARHQQTSRQFTASHRLRTQSNVCNHNDPWGTVHYVAQRETGTHSRGQWSVWGLLQRFGRINCTQIGHQL